MELLCIACSVGWLISLISFLLLALVGRIINGARISNGVALTILALILLTVGGIVGWAAQDQVCEMAEK